MLGRIDHIGVATEDLDGAIALYEGTLGMPVAHRETVESQGVEAVLLDVLGKLKEAGIELIDSEPRVGIRDSRVAFVHPKSTGGVLTELVEPSEAHS